MNLSDDEGHRKKQGRADGFIVKFADDEGPRWVSRASLMRDLFINLKIKKSKIFLLILLFRFKTSNF